MSAETAGLIQNAKERNGRVFAVGTTVARVLETVGDRLPHAVEHGYTGMTDLFIAPGYKWRVVDGLVTNFHLPRSTLLMLVSALAGRESILRAYAQAMQHGYRFFSFGDAMLIR